MTVLVIDIGSSSVRALLFDDEAQLIPGAVVAHRHAFVTDAKGASTADPLILQENVERAVDAILHYPAAQSISGVGMATFVGNVMGIDADGLPTTPIYSYADTRSREDVAILRDQIDVEDVHQRTGCPHHTAYHPARLHWLKRTQPDVFDATAQWVDFGAYLYTQWFGEPAACELSIAAWSGLLNRHTRTWDSEWLELLRLSPDNLPILDYPSSFMENLKPTYAERWTALRSVPFHLPMADGFAANVGAGAVSSSGTMALTVGTTAALRMMTREVPEVPSGLWCYRVAPDAQLLGGATSEGGNIFGWVRDTFALPPNLDLESSLSHGEPDGHGLTWLPLLAGERSPGWRSDATGTIHGLRLSSTPIDILQAALEGVANRLALIAEQLSPEVLPVIAGGGAIEASPVWAQIICNALNRPLHLIDEPETTARGVAISFYTALQQRPFNAIQPRIAATLTPKPFAAEKLLLARQRQLDLYRRLYLE
jgi:gluconokinase